MTIYVVLRDQFGHDITGLADPSGGTFDAAGDFDRFVDQPPYGQNSGSPLLQSMDPYGQTILPAGAMAGLIADVTEVLALSNEGSERRGLLRLRTLAEECSRNPGSILAWIGD